MNKYKSLICKINKKESGKRLDQALTNLTKNLSRSQIKFFIVNGNIKKSNTDFYDVAYKVKEGEIYKIQIPLFEDNNKILSQNIPLEIIFEDNDIIVINKESGIVVHPAPGNRENTLVNALLFHTKNSLSRINKSNRPGIVHRIDKETSGILVVAKNEFAHKNLSEQFKKHSIKRKYQALVWGMPKKLLIKGYIARHKVNRKKMSLSTNIKGRYSETLITIKKNYNICSLIDCNIKTGRTHQIRVHLDSIGSPIVGDKIYGVNKVNNFLKNKQDSNKFLLLKNFQRQALHAYLLGFYHPTNNKYIEFKANLPPDFLNLLQYLSKY